MNKTHLQHLLNASDSTQIFELKFVEDQYCGDYDVLLEIASSSGCNAVSIIETAREYLMQIVLDRRSRRIYDWAVIEYGYDQTDLYLELSKSFTKRVTGIISVSLYKGNINFWSAKNIPYSLYKQDYASMENVGGFDHKDAEGLCNILGIHAKAIGELRDKNGNKSIQ